MSDIVERLRKLAMVHAAEYDPALLELIEKSTCWQAADEIERLRAYKDSYPPDFIEKLQHDLDVAGIRIKELESTHDWCCGCGHWNGPNLPLCGQCGRKPGDEE